MIYVYIYIYIHIPGYHWLCASGRLFAKRSGHGLLHGDSGGLKHARFPGIHDKATWWCLRGAQGIPENSPKDPVGWGFPGGLREVSRESQRVVGVPPGVPGGLREVWGSSRGYFPVTGLHVVGPSGFVSSLKTS